MGGAAHWPLQQRLLLALAEGSECRLRAVFRRSQLPDLYEVRLISEVTVGSEPIQADVVATLNAALLLDPAAAARQVSRTRTARGAVRWCFLCWDESLWSGLAVVVT